MRQFLVRSDAFFIGLLAALIGLAYALALAHAPQNPDGAELVRAALSGGVLHAPGYPLQAWLGRLFMRLLPGGIEPTVRLSLLSWLAGVATVIALARGWRRERLGWNAVVGGAVFFALFPSVWYLAAQPEKYALLTMLLAMIWYRWTRLELVDGDRPVTAADSVGLGVLIGLALAQQPVAILYFPLVGVALWRMATTSRRALVAVARALGTCAIVAIGAYASLFLMTSGETSWPDWGRIESFADWWGLVTRADFKGLSPQGLEVNSAQQISALRFFARDLVDSLGVFGFLPIIGISALIARRRWSAVVAVGGSLTSVGVFLAWFAWSVNDPLGFAFLERFSVLPMLLLAGLAAHGIEAIGERLPARLRVATPVLVGAMALSCLVLGWPRADAGRDRMIDHFTDGLAAQLPADAAYVMGTDVEMFYGIPSNDGSEARRFPVFGDYPWALSRVAPRLDPRFGEMAAAASTSPSLAAYVAWSCVQGREVYSTMRLMLRSCRGYVQRRGLFWVARRDPQNELGARAVEDAVRLCPVLARMDERVPRQGHFYARYLLGWWVAAFENAANALVRGSDDEGARLAFSVAKSLAEEGGLPGEWQAGCERLSSHLEKQKRPGTS